MGKSVLEFDIGVIWVNDNNADITLGKIAQESDDDQFYFSAKTSETIFEAKDLRSIADKLDDINKGRK